MDAVFSSVVYKIPGLLTWDVINATCAPTEGASLSIVLNNEDICLYIAFSEAEGLLYFGRKTADAWPIWDNVPFTAKDKIVQLSILVEIDEVRISLGADDLFTIPNDGSFSRAYEIRGDLQVGEIEVKLAGHGLEQANKRIVTHLEALQTNDRLADYQGDLVFDVGMHDCRDTDFYLKKGYRVVAVEANPQLALYGARLFTKEVDEGRLTILNVGLGESRLLPILYQ